VLLRILTALPLIIGFVAAVYWAPALAWMALLAGILFLGAFEWAKLAKLGLVQSLTFAAVLTGMDVVLALAQLDTSPVFGVSLLFWLAVPVLLALGVRFESRVALLSLGFLVLLPIYPAMLELREISPDLLLAVVGLVVVADSGAYFTGRRFGRHKLAPRISPGKTWEGVAGAALAVALYVLLIQTQLKSLIAFHPGGLLMAAGVLLGLSIFGDLLESWIKRQAGVKDSGTLLPGHGGVLDRIDSLTAVLPAATLFYLWTA